MTDNAAKSVSLEKLSFEDAGQPLFELCLKCLGVGI